MFIYFKFQGSTEATNRKMICDNFGRHSLRFHPEYPLAAAAWGMHEASAGADTARTRLRSTPFLKQHALWTLAFYDAMGQ